MQAIFDAPLLSRPSFRQAPTRPTRKGSIDMNELVPLHSLSTTAIPSAAPHAEIFVVHPNTSPIPTRGSLRRETRISPITSLKPTLSMSTIDHVSQERQMSGTSTVLHRVNSCCDRIPTRPMRVATPAKGRGIFEKYSARQSSLVSELEVENYLNEDGEEKEEDSPAICKPRIKSNMFLQGISPFATLEIPVKDGDQVETSMLKCKQRTRTVSHINTHHSSTNILGAAE